MSGWKKRRISPRKYTDTRISYILTIFPRFYMRSTLSLLLKIIRLFVQYREAISVQDTDKYDKVVKSVENRTTGICTSMLVLKEWYATRHSIIYLEHWYS